MAVRSYRTRSMSGVKRKTYVDTPAGPTAPHHKWSMKEHRIYRMFRRKGYTKSHAWAATEGFAPRSIRKSGFFKTTPRTFSITHRRAALARRSGIHRL